MTVIYAFYDDSEGFQYFPTLKIAKEAARAYETDTGQVAIEKCWVADMPRRELYCRLLGNYGWQQRSEVVCFVRCHKRGGEA